MKKYKLAVMSTPKNQLSINTAWNTERCNKFFGTLFPELFTHLARHQPIGDPKASEDSQNQLWLGVIKTNQSVALSVEELPTGASLGQHARRKGHSTSERILYIGQSSLPGAAAIAQAGQHSLKDRSSRGTVHGLGRRDRFGARRGRAFGL
jgi:hypothetical protein